MTLTYGSLFAGIGGIDLGLERAGMRCAWQVEIDAGAQSVLSRHWPDVPKHADIRDCGAHNLARVDVVGGGFPCQGLSVAGERRGLADERSGLFYEMTRITDELRPAFLVWENVPGLFSSGAGRDFLAVLTELDRIGYVGGWRTLDAQYFGVAQRRRRVFGVFARRDIGARCCAEILSLATGMSGHPAPRREARQSVAASLTRSAGHHGRSSPRGDGSDNLVMSDPQTFDWQGGVSEKDRAWLVDKPGRTRALTANRTLAVFGGNNTSGERAIASALTSHGSGRYDFESENFVCGAQSAAQGGPDDNSAQSRHIVAATLGAEHGRNRGPGQENEIGLIVPQAGVRRLTPRECERLQGFPDDFTAGQSDSARYRQLGNAVAVPVAEWIGRRIVALHSEATR